MPAEFRMIDAAPGHRFRARRAFAPASVPGHIVVQRTDGRRHEIAQQRWDAAGVCRCADAHRSITGKCPVCGVRL